jgi:hypothetical protein
MIPELQAVTRRLEEVERQVAHLQAVAVEHSDTDQTVAARTVNAQTFVVTDAQGVRRAELSMSVPAGQTEEQPWLVLFDASGNARAWLGVQGGLPALGFYDANQKPVVDLSVDEDGPRMGLYYGNGKPAVAVTLSKAGPGVSLFGADGLEGASVQVCEGRSSLTLLDPSGKGALYMEVGPSGAKRLFMGELGSEAQESPVGPSLKLEVTSNGTRLQFGKDGRVFWSAPQGPPTGRG